jgi:hypothetical protein
MASILSAGTIEGNQITIPDTYVWNELTTSWDKLS